jgi:RimJ/RimL family protein N-acetyltransferase
MIVETSRLILRRWQPADREPWAAMNADPDVMRYFPQPLDRAGSDALIDRLDGMFDKYGYGFWAVEVRATAEFAGSIGLALQDYPAPFTPATEVGWRLARTAWGHGYATEGARASLRFAFQTCQLDDVISTTAVPNEPSQAVMRRLGMTRDPAEDFDHPRVPAGPLRRHVLYRQSRQRYQSLHSSQWSAQEPGDGPA